MRWPLPLKLLHQPHIHEQLNYISIAKLFRQRLSLNRYDLTVFSDQSIGPPCQTLREGHILTIRQKGAPVDC
jgi:hypothetical protein